MYRSMWSNFNAATAIFMHRALELLTYGGIVNLYVRMIQEKCTEPAWQPLKQVDTVIKYCAH
jgi:hypothetical protein